MSKQVDERVVSMQFDNKQFERNVSTTMSTLDKLKQKLNLSGASKGLENVGTAAKNVNMSGLGGAVEQVSAKFSALQVMGVTALANITNAAVNAGKRIVHSLTIAPITDGFNEYEMTLNAVQTTMAATGKTAEEVEQKLKKLDEYADKTVYSTADMLNNLPKFTNAGVDLDKSITAMIGIANATALAGGGANQASIAFYNLGQAIGTGYLTRMDYNSINNAGIATMEWKNQMVEAAIAQGTLTKVGEDAYQAGNKTLSLQQLFIDGLQEQWATTDVLMEVFSNYGDETTEIGKKSYAAAQDIKTFSQMMESLKATAGTGWKDTWQLIFGGLDEAKEFWTGLTNFISNIITSMAEFRNGLLESALGKGFTELSDKIKSTFKPASEAVSTAKEAVESVKDLGAVVDEVIGGKWGNGQKRWDALTEAGYNWAEVQNKVNETMGNTYRHSEDLGKSLGKQADAQKEVTEVTDENAVATSQLSKEEAKRIAVLATMSEEELKAKGYTDEQIAALRELAVTADKLGIPLEEFITNLDKINGRWLLINSFKNVGKGLVTVFTELGKAWKEVFPKTLEERAQGIFETISSIHKYTSVFAESLAANADEIQRTFKGVFAALDIVLTLVAGPLKIAFGIFKQILGALDMNVLEFTAVVGDNILKFRDWLKSVLNFTEVFKKIIPHVEKSIDAFKKWFDALRAGEFTPEQVANTIIKGFKKVIGSVGEVFKKLREVILGEAKGIPEDFISGFSEGILSRLGFVGKVLIELGKSILACFRGSLVIESPSKETYSDGENFVQGFINGVKAFIGKAVDVVKDFGKKCLDVIKNIDFGAVFAGIMGAGILAVMFKIAKALEAFSSPFENIGDMFESIGGAFDALKGTLKSLSTSIKAKALKDVAIAIGILAASVLALSFVPAGKLWGAIGALAALAAILGVLSFVAGKFGGISSFNSGKFAVLMISFGVALLLMAGVLKILESIDIENAKNMFVGLATAIGSLVTVLAAYGLLVKGKSARSIGKVGGTLIKLSIAILLMVAIAKILSGMSWDELGKAAAGIGYLSAIIVGLVAATKLAGNKIKSVGNMILKVGVALSLLVLAAKIVAGMTWEDMEKAGVGIAALSVIIVGLVAATRLASDRDISKAGSLIGSIGAAMLMMALTGKIIAGMTWEDMGKAGVGILALSAIIVGLVAATKLASDKDLKRVGSTLLMMSVSVGIMALVAALLGFIPLENLAKGVVAVAILGSVMALMVAATKNAQGCKGNIIAMTIAIGMLTVAVVALSFIPVEKALPAVGMLAALMLTFAAALKIIGTVGTLSVTGLVAMGLMLLVVAALTAALYLLSGLPAESAMGITVALSALMLAFAVTLAIISNMGSPSVTALVAMGIMTLVVAALAGVLYLLQDVDPTQAIKMVGVITVFLLAMEVVCIAAAAVGALAGLAIPGLAIMVGFIAALGLVVIGLAALAMDVIAGMPQLGSDLSAFMTNVQPFIDGVQNIPEGISDKIGELCGAILKLTGTEILAAIGDFLTGGSALSDLGAELKTFGESLAGFSSGTANIDTVIAIIGKIKEVSITADDYNLSGLTSFGNDLIAYSTKVAGLNTAAVSASITSARQLVTFIRSLSGLNFEGVANFKSAMAQLGSTSLDGFVNAFTSASAKLSTAGASMMKSITVGINANKEALFTTSVAVSNQTIQTFKETAPKFTEAGVDFITKLRLGMTESVTMLAAAGRTVANTAVTAIRTKYSDFYSAGSYCVDGFVNGISWNTYKATNAGYALGKAALNAAKAALREASPSKAFYEVAEYGVIGFVNAFADGLEASEKAGSDVANSALDGLSNTMSQIKSAVDSNIDVNPTIRPVLDLSNIQNGANSIGGMFARQTVALAGINSDYASINPTVGLTDLISQMKIDNDASNREVVNAITNLRGDFGSLVSAISGLHIRMDSGTVVGELIGKIDNSLGQIASYKGRGN